MPDWTSAIARRLATLRLAPAREREIVDELSQHLQDRYDELTAGGMPDAEARLAALSDLDATDLVRQLTGVERTADEPLTVGGDTRAPILLGLWQDLRYGLRMLARERAAAFVIVVTLGLAIAANTIVFGFADLLILRPLPIGHTDRLVTVYGTDRRSHEERGLLSARDYREIAKTSPFESLSAQTYQRMSLVGGGDPLAVTVSLVTANLFNQWDLQAIVGRAFLAGDDRPGAPPVVLLSHHLWVSRFASDPRVVGTAVTLNGGRYTVIGVVTPAIEIGSLGQIDVWLPLVIPGEGSGDDQRTLTVMGLLGSGGSVRRADAALGAIGERLERAYPVTNAGRGLRGVSLRESTVGASTWIILALLGVIVGLVLLVACANVATVMLARATARRRELAVRVAIGASRGRIVRQLLTEGLLLGLAGGVLGVLLAHFGLAAFKRLSPERYFQLLRVNGNLLAFAALLSLVAPVLFAVLPALQASRPDLAEDLKDGGRTAAPSRGGRSRSVLVVVQVAFALALLIVAGLVVRSIVAIERVPLGITVDGLLTVRARFDPPKYADAAAGERAIEQLIERLGGLPGVTSAAATSRLPVVGPEPVRRFAIDGQATPTAADVPFANETAVAGSYLQTFGVPLVGGRAFAPTDTADSPAVALVSQEAARRYWHGSSPVGSRVRLLDADGRPAGAAIEVVGVVGDVCGQSLAEAPPPRLYRPLAQQPADGVALALRVPGDPAGAAPAVRETLRAFDRDLATTDVRTYTSLLADTLRTYDLIIGLFAGFAAIALVLAVGGVYGVTAFAVGQRLHELGIRVALGATRASILRLVVGATARLVGIGSAAGLVLGVAIARTMKGVLYQVGSVDPATYLSVLALLGASGLAASLLPARRATRVDPVVALRQE